MSQSEFPMTSVSTPDDASTAARRLSPQRRLLFIAIILCLMALLSYFVIQVCLWVAYSTPLSSNEPLDAHRHFYDELFDRKILEAADDDSALRVLLLGGSVAEQVGGQLERELTPQLPCPVKVINAARSAHTTRDTLNKLEYLVDHSAKYDLIVVYHGINDVKLNQVTVEDFRDDYSHYGWYRQFEYMRAHGRFTISNLVDDAAQRLHETTLDKQSEMEFGNELKTPPAFEANMRRLLELAKEMDTPLVLMTFAIYLPDGYTDDAYRAGELDYAEGGFKHACDTWGFPENVRKTVDAHNERIQAVAVDCPSCPYVDMAVQIGDRGDDFSDVCHLSDAGIKRFCELAVKDILESEFGKRLSENCAGWEPTRKSPRVNSGDSSAVGL